MLIYIRKGFTVFILIISLLFLLLVFLGRIDFIPYFLDCNFTIIGGLCSNCTDRNYKGTLLTL